MRRDTLQGPIPSNRGLMRRKNSIILILLLPLAAVVALGVHRLGQGETNGGWVKAAANPVLGGSLGSCFDVCVLRDGPLFRMWFSWRPQGSVALVESEDGIHWSDPVIVLGPNEASGWEEYVNRPVVIKREDGYHMWYTGQTSDRSRIGYARSSEGRSWRRMSASPALSPERPWEKVAVMCPHVLWDERSGLYRMWYSGGGQYEPDAIGYATSPDGMVWSKHPNPVFMPSAESGWESHKVTACQVLRQGGWYLMFYIGFRDEDRACIGLARSRDGVTCWQRFRANPIISPGRRDSSWDRDAVYKPYALLEGHRWLLWYNGRRENFEQIGLAFHEGEDLGFDADSARPQ